MENCSNKHNSSFECDTVMVWTQYGCGLVMVWSWFGHSMVVVRSWYGHGLGTVWLWFGHGMVMALSRYAQSSPMPWYDMQVCFTPDNLA